MRSLPLHKAGVGSAVNDTTRELGGALGVAVMGSLVASQFRSSMQGAVSGLPERATHSLADALQSGAAAGGARGAEIVHLAQTSFVDAFTSTLWVGAIVVVVASGIVAWLLRPKATAKADAMVAAEEAQLAAVRTRSDLASTGVDAPRRGRLRRAELDLVEVLQALADPVRLQIVRVLADADAPIACHEIPIPVAKSTGRTT